MNLQTIKTDNQTLLVNISVSPTHRCWVWTKEYNTIRFANEYEMDICADEFEILGSTSLLEGVPLLPELPKQEEDVEQLVKKYAESSAQYDLESHDEGGYLGINTKEFAKHLLLFYKAASKGKLYSEEDLKQAARAAWQMPDKRLTTFNDWYNDWFLKVWQSISPVQEGEWMFEPEFIDEAIRNEGEDINGDNAFRYQPVLKTTTTPDGKTLIQGKWVRK